MWGTSESEEGEQSKYYLWSLNLRQPRLFSSWAGIKCLVKGKGNFDPVSPIASLKQLSAHVTQKTALCLK